MLKQVNGFYTDVDNEEPEEQGWLCVCGNWQDDDLHCSECGAEPPWGCGCEMHDEVEDDEVEGWEQALFEDSHPDA